MMFMVL